MSKPTPKTDKIIYAHHFVPGDLVDHACRLELENAELLAALKDAKRQITALCSPGDVPDSVNTAIKNATGESS